MAHYIVGDLQGCHGALVELLRRIDFSPSRDLLWCAGDLVNRGPDSLATLRLLTSLGSSADSVLGNHDFHLMATYVGLGKAKPQDRIDTLLSAKDGAELIFWLRHRPMLLQNSHHKVVLTHAGIPPCWNIPTAALLATEVEQCLQSERWQNLLAKLYGNKPNPWSRQLKGMSRLRCIINYLTRMRLCQADGTLEFEHKGGILGQLPDGFKAWFDWPHPDWEGMDIVFGHWSTLEQELNRSNIIALDTGCVWGGNLSAVELGSRNRIHIPCLLGGDPLKTS